MLRFEERRNVLAGLVHRRPNNMRRRLASKLDDMLGEIGLDAFDPGLEQGVRETDLLAEQDLERVTRFAPALLQMSMTIRQASSEVRAQYTLAPDASALR